MPPSRPYDALYDPLYMASDPRDYQISGAISSSQTYQRLPRFSNFFSELPNYPSHSFRSSTSPMRPLRTVSEGGTSRQGPLLNGTCTAPPMSFQESSSPKTYSPSRNRSGLRSPPRSIPAQQVSDRLGSSGDWMDYDALAHRIKMKEDFEASLPPLSDSKSLSERKKMLEAWEKAEWSAREVQLQTFQEEQLQAFQADMVAQDGKAEQMISQRLLSRQNGGSPKSQHGQSQRTPYSKQPKGGRSAGKQRRLTPLESFVHSNTPLQGRSLFKSKSQSSDMQLTGRSSKGQATTKTLPFNGGALRSASDIGAYRPQAGRTAARKEAAYAQHLDNVHRAILQEKELEARREIASQLASPPEPHPKAFPEQAAIMNHDAMTTNGDITMAHDNGAAQVLLLGSRGSTAEGWLTTPDSASSPVRDLLTADSSTTEATEEAQLPLFQEGRNALSVDSAPTEAFEEAQSPLLQEGFGADWLDKQLIAADTSNNDAATSAAAAEEKEALPGHPAEAETGAEDTLPLESTWGMSHHVETPAEDAVVWASSEGSAAGGPDQASAHDDIIDAVAEGAALKSLEDGDQIDEPLLVQEAVAATVEEYADEPLAEPAVEEFQADEDIADKPMKDIEEGEDAPVEERSLAPEAEELVRPHRAISAMVESLTEAAAIAYMPAQQEGQIEVSDSELQKTDPLNAVADIGAVTLDHLISQHYRQSSLLASAGADSQLQQNAVAADSTGVRATTAVSQTMIELVAAAEAQLPLLLAVPAAVVQDAEEQNSPGEPAQDGHLALAPDSPDMPLLLAVPAEEVQGAEEQSSPADPVHDGHLAPLPDTPSKTAAQDADMSLVGAASVTTEQPAHSAGLTQVDTQPDMAEAELLNASEVPAEVHNISTIEENDTTRSTLAELVEEGSEHANTAAQMGHADPDPAADLQGEYDAANKTPALGPTEDTEAHLQEAEAQYDNETYDDSIKGDQDSEGKAELLHSVDEVVEESIGGLMEDAVASL